MVDDVNSFAIFSYTNCEVRLFLLVTLVLVKSSQVKVPGTGSMQLILFLGTSGLGSRWLEDGLTSK